MMTTAMATMNLNFSPTKDSIEARRPSGSDMQASSWELTLGFSGDEEMRDWTIDSE